MMRFIRNTKVFAFVQGFYEYWRNGDGMGRTHPTDQDWNEAYDRGRNFYEKVTS